MERSKATSLLITQKDEVKMVGFKLPLSVMKLELQIKNYILEEVDRYIEHLSTHPSHLGTQIKCVEYSKIVKLIFSLCSLFYPLL